MPVLVYEKGKLSFTLPKLKHIEGGLVSCEPFITSISIFRSLIVGYIYHCTIISLLHNDTEWMTPHFSLLFVTDRYFWWFKARIILSWNGIWPWTWSQLSKKIVEYHPKKQLLISLFFIFYTVLSYKYLHLYKCSLVFVIVIYTICPSLIVDRLIKMYITSMTLSYNVPNKSGRSHSCIHNSIHFCVDVEFKANER